LGTGTILLHSVAVVKMNPLSSDSVDTHTWLVTQCWKTVKIPLVRIVRVLAPSTCNVGRSRAKRDRKRKV